MGLLETMAMVGTIKPGKVGAFYTKEFTVSHEDAESFNFRQTIQGCGNRYIMPGTYVGLYERGGDPWMSDTTAERKDHRDVAARIAEVGGRILVAGLGLGMIVKSALSNENVRSVTVLEIQPDVIELVAPCFDDERLEIIEADAWKWKPPAWEHFDIAYFDIWRDLDTDHLMEYGRMKRRYSRCSDERYCWCQPELAWRKRQGQ